MILWAVRVRWCWYVSNTPFSFSEESYVVLDYATVEKVEVEEEMTDSKLNLKLMMSPNSEGRCEQMIFVAESK